MTMAPRLLTFQELTDSQSAIFPGEQVEIRGFLHQNAEGQWLLSSQATLKSCCASGRLCKSGDPLLIKEELSGARPGGIAHLQGRLFKEEGSSFLELKEIAFVFLDSSTQQIPFSHSFEAAILFFIFLTLFLFYALFRSMRKKLFY